MVAILGVITPPVGMNVYVVKGLAKEVPLETIFRGIWPFVIAILVGCAVLIAFPDLATVLPRLMK
ncbi:MAG: TRAP transporter large permease subunit [Moorellales bacterium]